VALRKAEPLFGAPTGNRVMKAKRITGESAMTILNTHVRNERCNVRGCANHVCVTRNPDGVTKLRQCIDHVGTSRKPRKGGYKLTDLLKFGWQD
jgi:hypothetical protein